MAPSGYLSTLTSTLVAHLLAAMLMAPCVSAAIIRDGTVGPGSAVQPAGPNYIIPASQGTQSGANLFHSFSTFNISSTESATFTPSGATGPISNVIARVTGGGVSTLDGLLSSSRIIGANFFLLNPNGLIFGPNAVLDVGGSFHASTADYLRFRDGNRFSAAPNASDVLSVADPISFGFLGSNPGGSIRIDKNFNGLVVPQGATLSLIGGEIVAEGDPNAPSYTLLAPSGRINLISTASPGEVNLTLPDLGISSFRSLGPITFFNYPFISVGGNDPATMSGGTLFVRGGRISFSNLGIDAYGYASGLVDIKGDTLTLDGVGISAINYGSGDPTQGRSSFRAALSGDFTMSNGAFIDSSNYYAGRGGDIAIVADRVNLSGGSFIRSNSYGEGRAGDITITSPTINLTDLSYLQSNVFSSGDAGKITLKAGELNIFSSARIISQTDPGSTGKAADIVINAATMKLGDDIPGSSSGAADGNYGYIASQTDGGGDGGNITLNATGKVTVQNGFSVTASTESNGTGNAGNITLTADSLSITNKAALATTTHNSGSGGTVSVTARDVFFSGTHMAAIVNRTNDTGIVAQSFGSSQNGGKVLLTADTVAMVDGGKISTMVWGSGKGAVVDVTAKNLTISGYAQDAAVTPPYRLSSIDGRVDGPFASGSSGAITVKADTLRLDNGGVIRTGLYNSAPGNAGDIFVSARNMDIALRGQIYADSFRGTGNSGNISVTADALRITGAQGSPRPGPLDFDYTGLSTSTNAGRGGTVTAAINGDLTLSNGGGIKADTQGIGAGGSIAITAGTMVLASGGQINSASTGAGSAGNIRLTAGQSLLMRDSFITSEATHSSGGDITVNSAFKVSLINSLLSARVQGDAGTMGGKIALTPRYLILKNSRVDATAIDGAGGLIDIKASTFLADPFSQANISAASQFGTNGTVAVKAAVSSISGVVSPLSSDFLKTSVLLRESCLARIREGGAYSSFVVGGRDGLPLEPGNLIPGTMY